MPIQAEAKDEKKDVSKKKSQPTKQVRVPADLAEDIFMVAASKGMDTSEYLEPILRPIVDKDLTEVIKEKQQGLQKRKKGGQP